MNNFIQQVKLFYVRDFLRIRETWHISQHISSIQLLIENLQMLSILTQRVNKFEFDNFLEVIQSVLNYLCYYPIVGNSLDIQIGFVIIGFILETSYLILVIILISLLKYENKKLKHLKQLPLQNHSQIQTKVHHTSNLLFSIHYQLHKQLLYIPFMYASINLLYQLSNKSLNSYQAGSYVLAVVLIIEEFGIELFKSIQQFEYRMKQYNYLGKFSGYKHLFIFIFQTLIIFLSSIQIDPLILQLLGVIYSIIHISLDYNQVIFVDFRISSLHFIISLIILFYQVLLIFCAYTQPTLHITFVYFLVLMEPFIFSISIELSRRKDNKFFDFTHLDLEKQIRRLYIIFRKQIQLKKQQRLLDPIQSLQIYTFITTHLRECKLLRDKKAQKNIKLKYKCFCTTFFKDDDTFSTLEQMKSFAKELIGQTLEDELMSNSKVNLLLIYIYFLVQVKKVPTQAIYEVIRLSNSAREKSFKMRAIIFKLKQDALDQFSDIVKKNDLVNQKFVFKKVYEYEEALNIFKENLLTVVKQEKDFYSCILTQIINVDQLTQVGFQLLNNIKTIEQQLQLLYRVNPSSNECDTLYNIFAKYINFNKVRPKLYKREGQIMTQFMQSDEKIIFDPGSCVIQITLLQPRGNVIRYTRGFQKAIQYKDEEILNQNIKQFMPSIIGIDHDLYLDNFVERGRINVVRYAIRVILGKTKSQFVVPINTRLRIETSATEFGATALITPVNLTYGYIMLNEAGKIEELTKNMFDDIFEKHLGLELELIKGLDCLVFIPELSKIWNELFDEHFEKLDKKFDCQMILPNFKKQWSKTVSLSRATSVTRSQLQRNILKNFEHSNENILYQISLHLTSLITINLRLVILEIPDYKQISNKSLNKKSFVQIQQRSSHLMNIPQFITIDVNSQRNEQYSQLLNSPPTQLHDCDLEYSNFIEEMKMGEELKNHLATINNTNTLMQQSNSPFLFQSERQITDRAITSQQQVDLSSQQISEHSGQESRFRQENQLEQNPQYNNGSVGSRSSQNNVTSMKRQMKESLSDQQGISNFTKFFLLCFYIFVLVGYALNFSLIYLNLQYIKEKQYYENIPINFQYFYNEFIISLNYLNMNSLINIYQLRNISFEFYKIHIQDIDNVVFQLQYLNNITGLTMEIRMVDIFFEMSEIIYAQSNFQSDSYLINNNQFKEQQQLIINKNESQAQYTLSYFVIFEELLLIFLLILYIYFCIMIIKMKMKIYKLFCTFSKEVIQEQFLQFSSLLLQLNNSAFKQYETDEEQFEIKMMRQYQRTVTSNILGKHGKVGKQISIKNINKAHLMFFIFIFIYAFMCSFYFIGSFILQDLSMDFIASKYNQKKNFEEALIELAVAYSQMEVILNSTITSDLINLQLNTTNNLGEIRESLQLFQESDDQQIYQILIDDPCLEFSQNLYTGYQNFDELFSNDICSSLSILTKGISVAYQDLYSFQLSFSQTLSQTNPNLTTFQNQYQIQTQRLYVEYFLLSIVTILSEQVETFITSTILINSLMLSFSSIVMSISLYITKITFEQVKQQYQSSKQLLSLFPYDKLMENAYVMSFISQDLNFNI